MLSITVLVVVLLLRWLLPRRRVAYQIEGNIGCGKTSLIGRWCQGGKAKAIEEFVDERILKIYYDNIADTAAMFQTIMLHRAIDKIDAAGSYAMGKFNDVLLYDRGVLGVKVFSDVLFKSKHINEQQLKILNVLLDSRGPQKNPLLMLYACPETCLERIKRRGRPSEAKIDLDYLCNVEESYFLQLLELSDAGQPFFVKVWEKPDDSFQLPKNFSCKISHASPTAKPVSIAGREIAVRVAPNPKLLYPQQVLETDKIPKHLAYEADLNSVFIQACMRILDCHQELILVH